METTEQQLLASYKESNRMLADSFARIAHIEKCLKMIDEALKDGLTIEKNDPIHKQVGKVLEK